MLVHNTLTRLINTTWNVKNESVDVEMINKSHKSIINP